MINNVSIGLSTLGGVVGGGLLGVGISKLPVPGSAKMLGGILAVAGGIGGLLLAKHHFSDSRTGAGLLDFQKSEMICQEGFVGNYCREATGADYASESSAASSETSAEANGY